MPSMLSDIARNIAPPQREPLAQEGIRGSSRNLFAQPTGGQPAPQPMQARDRRRPRQRPQKQDPWSNPEYLEDVGARLAAKALTGHGVPARGVVPMARLPEQYAAMVQGTQPDTPVQGWDPSTLEPDEAELLFRLMGAAQGNGGA